MIIKLYNELSSMCFGRSHVLGFQAIFIFFHCFPVPCTCSAEPLLATAGVWTVQEVQFFSVIGDGSIVPAAESALQRFIHAFLCCPAKGQGEGRVSDSPLRTLTGAMEVCQKRSVTSGPVTFNQLYTGKCTNASAECKGKGLLI